MRSVHGLHHVTCIAGPAQENLDFYVRVLGMRLVKRSVNQDDPGTYHLFYADAAGRSEASLGVTGSLLERAMGLQLVGTESEWHRYGVEGGNCGRYVDVREVQGAKRGAWGTGSIHHLAWGVDDEAQQSDVRSSVEEHGAHPTPMIDRFWFKSVYFKEPGGALFELATDGRGVAVYDDL